MEKKIMNKLEEIIAKKVAEIKTQYRAPGSFTKKLFDEKNIMPSDEEILKYVEESEKNGSFSLRDFAKWILTRK